MDELASLLRWYSYASSIDKSADGVAEEAQLFLQVECRSSSAQAATDEKEGMSSCVEMERHRGMPHVVMWEEIFYGFHNRPLQARIIGCARYTIEGEHAGDVCETWIAMSRTCRCARALSTRLLRVQILEMLKEIKFQARITDAVDQFQVQLVETRATLGMRGTALIIQYSTNDEAEEGRDLVQELFVQNSGISPILSLIHI